MTLYENAVILTDGASDTLDTVIHNADNYYVFICQHYLEGTHNTVHKTVNTVFIKELFAFLKANKNFITATLESVQTSQVCEVSIMDNGIGECFGEVKHYVANVDTACSICFPVYCKVLQKHVLLVNFDFPFDQAKHYAPDVWYPGSFKFANIDLLLMALEKVINV